MRLDWTARALTFNNAAGCTRRGRLQHLRPRDFLPAVADDVVATRATLALGVSLLIGSLFWAMLLLAIMR